VSFAYLGYDTSFSSDSPSVPVRSHTTWNVTWGVLALLCVTLFYAFAVIRNFSGPIGDYSESFLYEYLPWYASKHLSLWPIPHLSLHTNEVLYPFGGNVALQSWCVERDILFALLKPHFPHAPLLQIYYLLGVAISTLGSYLLLLPRHGARRAALTTVIAHAFNFYSMQKYAYHYNIACHHWTTLGIVCDFVIVSRVVAERSVSLRLLLLRVLLLVLAFGLELGHVLGYSLTSVLFASGYLLWFVIREVRAGRLSIAQTRTQWKLELKEHRTLLTLLIVSTLAVAWIYLGVTAGIVRDSLAMGKFPGNSGVWWAVPLRLLIPYTPWLHPSMQPPFLHVLGDVAETGIGGGGAGLFLLLIGMVGIYQAKAYRSHSAHFPVFLSFVLYVVSGAYLPLLKLLPWFLFCRVYSRATLVYSTLLALFAIDISLQSLRPVRRYLALLCITALGTLELTTIVLIKGEHPTYSFSNHQLSYFDTIKRHPGEAILDFPFCLTGGNGDIAGLCPYWERNKGVYALARFHEKKVIGQYLGRLHPTQAAPFVEQGWDELYDPDIRDFRRATRQVRCLTEDEWTFFEQFYLYNDFAGIQLASDLLPSGCADQFYARFGQPTARMELRGLGPLVFIAKPAALRSQVDPERGKQVRLRRHDPGQLTRRYTALDLQRSDEGAVAIRSDLHGQPTVFEFLAGKSGAIFGPYDTFPAGEYVVRFDLELTKPATGKVATLDMIGGLGSSTYGSHEARAEQLAGGRTAIEFPARLPQKSARIEVRLHSHGAGLLVHGVTVRRVGPPQNP
jgi:hypothetical protein